MSLPKTAAQGDEVSTLWYVEPIISALTASCMSKLDVRNMSVKTPWIRSSVAFACGFLILVGLRLSLYELHRDLKWSLNSLLLSKVIHLAIE